MSLLVVEALTLHTGERSTPPQHGVELTGLTPEALGRLSKGQVHRIVPLLVHIDVFTGHELVIDAGIRTFNCRGQIALVEVRRVVKE